jgi:hypothetical protein
MAGIKASFRDMAPSQPITYWQDLGVPMVAQSRKIDFGIKRGIFYFRFCKNRYPQFFRQKSIPLPPFERVVAVRTAVWNGDCQTRWLPGGRGPQRTNASSKGGCHRTPRAREIIPTAICKGSWKSKPPFQAAVGTPSSTKARKSPKMSQKFGKIERVSGEQKEGSEVEVVKQMTNRSLTSCIMWLCDFNQSLRFRFTRFT